MNIYIKAYIHTNLGDDLFIKMLCERYPQHQFYMGVTRNNRTPFENIENLILIDLIRYVDVIFNKLKINYSINSEIEKKIVNKCDCTVNIGGSIFMESKNSYLSVSKYDKLVENSKHFFVMGSNFGPFTSNSFLQTYKEIFNRMDDVCFRDNKSYNLFSELNNVRVAPDIVFSLDKNKVRDYQLENYIVISLMDFTNNHKLYEYNLSYLNAIEKITRSLIEKGKKVVLMGFCEKEGDKKAIRHIEKKIDNENLLSYLYNGDINEALSLLKSSKGIVATRFHSLVLALLFEKSVYPFVYSEKTLNLLNDIEFNYPYCEINSPETFVVEEAVNRLLDETPMDIKLEMDLAVEHFKGLDVFLKK